MVHKNNSLGTNDFQPQSPSLRVVGFEGGKKGKWKEYRRGDTCPICGNDGWCSRLDDGRIVDCKKLADKSKGWYRTNGVHNFHRPDGDLALQPRQARDASPPDEIPIADLPTRHRVYEALLQHAELNDRHRADLEERSFDLSLAAERRMASLPEGGRDGLADKVRLATGLT